MELLNQIQKSVAFIRGSTDFKPRIAIILGTGLAGLVDDITNPQTIHYQDIPYFPKSTVQSHRNELIFGYLQGFPVVVMAGRFHYYEGYTMKQVTYPVRVMKELGIERLIISNVSGSINSNIHTGDLVFIRDHINLMPENPLRGEHDDRLGPRFPDMKNVYDSHWIEQGMIISKELNYRAHSGVYVAWQGPNLETPAEYNFLHIIGGDLVGMSSVPEAIVARQMGIPVFAMSVVSNQCYPIDLIKETTVEEVIEVAQDTGIKMRVVIGRLLALLIVEKQY